MTDFDVSPELQRLVINLMLAALHRLNKGGQGGQGHGLIEDFDVSPEVQRKFMNTLQSFAVEHAKTVSGKL